MKKWLIGTMVCVLSAVVFLAACKKKTNDDDTAPSNDFDRKAMLTNYADNYIVPAYTVMESSLQELKARTEIFTSIPSEQNLDNLLMAWEDAYIVWQRADMLEFGPAEDVSLRMYMNTYPVTVAKVESNINSGSYDLESFNNKDAQGFPAVNYLLSSGDKASIVTLYTTDPKAAARKQYLLDVVNKMLKKIQGVKSEWATYRNTFVNATGTDAGSSTSKLVNAFVLYYERYFRSGKIGLPVGAMTGVAKPELAEAYYTPESSNLLAVRALSAVMAFYEGRSFDGNGVGSSMKSYLKAIGTKDDNGMLMSDVIATELTDVDVKLKALNIPLRTAVQNNRPQVLAIYDEAQQVVPLIKVDMVSAFGISITYVDNDGD